MRLHVRYDRCSMVPFLSAPYHLLRHLNPPECPYSRSLDLFCHRNLSEHVKEEQEEVLLSMKGSYHKSIDEIASKITI